MTRKHRPRLCIQRRCSESCRDRRVLNIGMSQPILHKRQISVGVEHVCRHRMLQQWNLCSPPVCSSFARSSRSERSEEHTSELQSLAYLVCRLLLEKKK